MATLKLTSPRKMPKGKPAPVAAPAAPVVAPAAPAAPVVALRGGLAVQAVMLAPGRPYRTSAAHTAANWQTIAAACAAAPGGVVAVAALLPPADSRAAAASHKANGAGAWVPGHFVGYCLRRGYLVAATLPAQAA